MRLSFGLGIVAAIWFTSLFFVCLFIDTPWLCHALSMIITSFVFFEFVFHHVTFIVPPDMAWIIVNPFISQSLIPGVDDMGFRSVPGQTEFQFGFHWKYPWEGFGDDVEMKRAIPVHSDPDRTYTFIDGHTIKIEWQITVVPLPGRIVNFHRTEREDIIRRVKTRAEAFFQGYIGSIPSLHFDDEAREQLEHEFETIYKGSQEIDDEEDALGIWTGTPEIYDMGNPEGVEEAINFEVALEEIMKAAVKMVKKSKGHMKFEKAMDICWKMKAAQGGKSNILLADFTSSDKPQDKRKVA